MPRGGIRLVQSSRKKGLFHNRVLYVRNVKRVSNSCKIGLKGYDFFGDLTYLELFLCKICVRG